MLTNIIRSIEERELGLRADRACERVRPIVFLTERADKIRHEVSWEDKGTRDTARHDVPLDLGLGVKVWDMGQSPSRCLGHVEQG